MITSISKRNLSRFNRGGGAKQFFPIHHTQRGFNMIEDMKIFHKTYEFIKWLHTLLNKFPKSEKYTMAQKIENTSLSFLESIIQSNNDFDKKQSLQKAIIELDKLRIFFRLSKDLQFISFDQYEYGSELINEIGKMLGGWYKKYNNIPLS
jgi:four helix bundle protein